MDKDNSIIVVYRHIIKKAMMKEPDVYSNGRCYDSSGTSWESCEHKATENDGYTTRCSYCDKIMKTRSKPWVYINGGFSKRWLKRIV